MRNSCRVGEALFVGVVMLSACGQPPDATIATGGAAGRAGAGAGGTAGRPGGSGGSAATSVGGTGAGTGGAAGQGSSGGSAGSAPSANMDTRDIQSVTINGYQLLVSRKNPDGSTAPAAPFDMRGINWSPYGVGELYDTTGGNFVRFASKDVPLLRDLHVNTIKTYGPFPANDEGRRVLDQLHANGIAVAMTVMSYYYAENYLQVVQAFKDHPAILFWVVGNEWNYNGLYSERQAESAERVSEVIGEIKAIDSNHPVATSYGELPTSQTIQEVSAADLWLINLYPGLDFGDRFSRWRTLSNKPMIVGEYGADAYDTADNREDQSAQAEAVRTLTGHIRNNLSKDNGVAVGGILFAFSDEWWKGGDPFNHGTSGFENAIHPDGHATEEWWGVVDINRTPREAYRALADIYR